MTPAPCAPGMHAYAPTTGGWTCTRCAAWYPATGAEDAGQPPPCLPSQHAFTPSSGGQWICQTCGQAVGPQPLAITP
jgi:hypothetical protein